MKDKFKPIVWSKSNTILFPPGLQRVYVVAAVAVVSLVLFAALSAALIRLCKKQKLSAEIAGELLIKYSVKNGHNGDCVNKVHFPDDLKTEVIFMKVKVK